MTRAHDADAVLLDASRRELALYRELVAIYDGLIVLVDEPEPVVDTARLAAGSERAEQLSAELRALAGVLAPARLGTDAVPVEVRALWRTSADLAAEASAQNARLAAAARARQAAIGVRLRELGTARRALGAYRPSGTRASAAQRA